MTNRQAYVSRLKIKPERRVTRKRSVLFVCVHNSARSFMAEYIGRAKYPDISFKSAGIHPLAPDPEAVAVLKEDGIHPEGHPPRTIGSLSGENFDLVVFLCRDAMKLAYSLPESKEVMLREFRVPSGGASRVSGFRELREDLKVFIDEVAEIIER